MLSHVLKDGCQDGEQSHCGVVNILRDAFPKSSLSLPLHFQRTPVTQLSPALSLTSWPSCKQTMFKIRSITWTFGQLPSWVWELPVQPGHLTPLPLQWLLASKKKLGSQNPEAWASNLKACLIWGHDCSTLGTPTWHGGKESTCQCRRCKRCNPSVGKILWRRKWQPTPIFLPGKSYGQRSVAAYSPQGHKELEMTEYIHIYW